MFERFTERARRVIIHSQEEAKRLRHDSVDTEDILLGLIREGGGVAVTVLQSFGVSLDNLRKELEGARKADVKHRYEEMAFTPRAKKVLELAVDEARRIGHNYIGTEHLLLGLFREEKGAAARALLARDLDLERVRSRVVHVLEESHGLQISFLPIPIEQAQQFLAAEARLLDERRFDEWEALFTDDGTYWLPIDPEREAAGAISIILDDRQRLHERVYRLTQTPVLDQNPHSRTVRFVSNVEVDRGAANGDATVRCNQLITEMRPGGPGQFGLNAPRWFAARCEYRLRRVGDAWKIAQKKVVFLNSGEPHYNLSFIP